LEKRKIGGIFLWIGGFLAVANAARYFIAGSEAADLDIFGFLSGLVYTCGAIELILGIIAIVGGLFAWNGRSYGFALTGSIICLISIGYFLLGSLFGLIALILIATSKEEFAGQAPAYPPGYPAPYPPGQPPYQQPYPGQYAPPPGQYPPQQPPPPPQQYPPTPPPPDQGGQPPQYPPPL
jgi:hypothetical protein